MFSIIIYLIEYLRFRKKNQIIFKYINFQLLSRLLRINRPIKKLEKKYNHSVLRTLENQSVQEYLKIFNYTGQSTLKKLEQIMVNINIINYLKK